MCFFKYSDEDKESENAKIKQNFYKNIIIKSNDCWDYKVKSRNCHFGYGKVANGKHKYQSAHRFSWELHNGPIPETMVVRHLCHNPACVRPSHLALGSQKDNYNDSKSVGRHSHGSKHGNSIINEITALEIKKMLTIGCYTYPKIAEMTKTTKNIVKDIARGKTWLHINVDGFKPTKGKKLKGESNGSSKLAEEQVKEIKKLIAEGGVCNHIAKLYNVNFSTIARIRDHKTWSHVTPD